jgi:hypothetical protein
VKNEEGWTDVPPPCVDGDWSKDYV